LDFYPNFYFPTNFFHQNLHFYTASFRGIWLKISNSVSGIGNIWRVHSGSLRIHRAGNYATETANATAPLFCCKRTNYLHYAEPANKENADSSWDRDWESDEDDDDARQSLKMLFFDKKILRVKKDSCMANIS